MAECVAVFVWGRLFVFSLICLLLSKSQSGGFGIPGDAEVVPRPVRGTTGLAVPVGDDAEPDGAAG